MYGGERLVSTEILKFYDDLCFFIEKHGLLWMAPAFKHALFTQKAVRKRAMTFGDPNRKADFISNK